jgi:hypothetical protein
VRRKKKKGNAERDQLTQVVLPQITKGIDFLRAPKDVDKVFVQNRNVLGPFGRNGTLFHFMFHPFVGRFCSLASQKKEKKKKKREKKFSCKGRAK